jgi:hypothetical protein
MGFEIKYTFHTRKEDGTYITEETKERYQKVGKPFDDTTLDKCAAAILSQLARRDIWVVGVEVYELVKKQISFKEATDGKGIVLKNKKFSLNGVAQAVEEEEIEEPVKQSIHPHQQSIHPHQQRNINTRKTLYEVYFDPAIQYVNEVKKLKFTRDRKYQVYEIVPHPSGKLDAQKIVVADDAGRIVTVDEKYFVNAGRGLFGDEQLNFSGSNGLRERRPKLSYEDEFTDIPQAVRNIPIDTGQIPEELLQIPDIRKG